MLRTISATICTALVAVTATNAAETITYTYDPHGRLTQLQVAGGPSSGVTRSYAYDATNNRTSMSVRGSISIAPAGATANTTQSGVSIGVNLSGISGISPTGTVTFTENGQFLGSTSVYDSKASAIFENFVPGDHTITVTYSGDGANSAFTYTFTIKVQDLRWLPAVLEILLPN